jgi:hypothetical protein
LKRLIVIIIASTLVLAVAVPWRSPVGAFAVSSGTSQTKGLLQAAPDSKSHKPVCGPPAPQFAKCHADVVVNAGGTPNITSSPDPLSYGPTELHMAYQLPCTPRGSVQVTCAAPASYGPQTIAIVDAYGSPTAEIDLNAYSTQYGIPACTTANGCFKVVDENGGSGLPTTANANWGFETSLDVQVAHALCQTCKILLVETNSAGFSDLGTGVKTAAGLGATAISNSYGGSESSLDTTFDAYYNQPGVAVVASSGDSGYGVLYPASSPYVVSVGGTTLQTFTDGTYFTESAWSGAGSGCSSVETAPTMQQQQPWYSQTGCGTKRAVADISADANPSTGAAVYDSTPLYGTTGWYTVGGTSLSAPIVASEFALAGGVPAGTSALAMIYGNVSSSNFHDVTSGSNGTCVSTIMCTGLPKYDGPTGFGSLNGLAAISSAPLAVATSPPAPATSTPIPATNTPAPATNTPILATNTPAPAATSTPTPKPTSTIAPVATATKTPAPTATRKKH